MLVSPIMNTLFIFSDFLTQDSGLGFPCWMLVWGAAVVILGFLLSILTTQICSVVGSRFFKLGNETLAASFFKAAQFGVSAKLIFSGVFWYAGLRVLPLSSVMQGGLLVSLKVLVYLGLSLMIWQSASGVKALINRRYGGADTRMDALLGPLVSRTIQAIAVIFAVLSLAEILHFPIASILTGLGIGGVAIAMAAKETVANVFGSLTILFDRPFQIGDWIKVGDVEGTVEEVGFRSTRVRTFYDSVVSVPNANILTAVVDNMGERKVRRFQTQFHLSVATPPEQVTLFCEKVKSLAHSQSDIRAADISVVISEISASSGILIQLNCYLHLNDGMAEIYSKHAFFAQVLQLAQEVGVSWHQPA
jgi:MscS family membrane protein